MSEIRVAKRGRPSNADIAARKAAEEARKAQVRTDTQILSDLTERFDVLSRLTRGAISGDIRSVVVAGAPGVGKTYTVENILSSSDTPHTVVRGTLSAINLYMLAYNHRKQGSVIVLDDADGIFNNEDALNILKALCDTSLERKVSYLKEANELKEADIPQEFVFNGAMIFISNLDFQAFIDAGGNKYAMHFEALMSRSHYLELRLHSRAEIGVWVNHIAKTGRIFERENVPASMHQPILDFVQKHREQFRELSIRTLLKLSGYVKANVDTWESDARILLLRTN